MASSSSSSTMPSSISTSSAAASSSRPPAGAALAPGLDYDTAFPVLGSSPSRPRSRSAARPPRPLTRNEDRRGGGKTPGYTVDRDNVGMPLGSLYGRADDAAPRKTAATAEAGHAAAAPPTSSVPAKAGTISARPPTCAAPGSFVAAAGVLSGAPALLPAVQVFGGYSFGYTMGDLFQDLELLQVELPDLRQHPQVVDEPRHPPPLRFQVQPPLRPQMLQPPRYFNAPMVQVQLQRFGGQQSQVPARQLHQRGASDAARGAAPPLNAIPVRAPAQALHGFRQGSGARTAAARQGTGQLRQYLVQRRCGDSCIGGVILLRTGALDWEVRCVRSAEDGDDAMPSTSANAITSGTTAKVGGPMAATDVLLARGRYEGGVAIRLRVATNIGASYWLLGMKDWICELMGSPPPYRPTESWSWIDMMGCPIPQDKSSCSQSACLMCLEAQHRLAFERRHGSDTFPYYIPASTATDLVTRCKCAGVWSRKEGASVGKVLEQIQRAGGAEAWPDNDQEGWEEKCKLQVKSWDTWSKTRLPSASSLARTIRTEGPLIGCLVVGRDYYAHGWEKRVYRGGSGKKASPHGVVCTGYRYEGEEIQVVDNHYLDGPARWISKTAFTSFTRIKVDPLDACSLGKEVSWWRHLVRRLWREETCWWLRRLRISEHWKKKLL